MINKVYYFPTTAVTNSYQFSSSEQHKLFLGNSTGQKLAWLISLMQDSQGHNHRWQPGSVKSKVSENNLLLSSFRLLPHPGPWYCKAEAPACLLAVSEKRPSAASGFSLILVVWNSVSGPIKVCAVYQA